MKRRQFVQLGMLAGTGAISGAAPAAAGPVNVVEAGVAELQAAMGAGKLTSRQLVNAYLARIRALDQAGPRINAIIELNPDAASIAAALDTERQAKGARGPLHGIPILLKDNIDTADRMQTTAGSLALVGSRPPRDAFVVHAAARGRRGDPRQDQPQRMGQLPLDALHQRLERARRADAQSLRARPQPLRLELGLGASRWPPACAPLAVGTETDGSIICPSNVNGIVGLKPTLGLVSRSGIIPIAHSQDTAGPMTRSVRDAALLLTALAGSDPRDAATAEAVVKATDYTRFLDRNGLQGKRLGVVRSQFGGRNDLASAVIEAELAVLQQQGATLVELPELPHADKYDQSEYEVLLHELKADMAAYLAEYAPDSPHRTLADLIAFNEKHRARELAHFGQEHFIRAQAKGGLQSREYRDALANNLKYARTEGIDKAMAEHRLDALVAPAGGPAWLTDLINGDASGASFTSPAAVAGYPHLTVPAGQVHGLPCGISFVGTAWAERRRSPSPTPTSRPTRATGARRRLRGAWTPA